MTLVAKEPRAKIIVRVMILAAKLGIAALLVGWLFSQHRFNLSLITHLHSTPQSIALFGAAAVSVFAGLFIMSWRFEQLLRHVGFSIKFREALGLTFIGSFTGAVLPGLIGGDVVKAVYLCRSSTHQRSEALSAVMVDRIIGLYALISLSVLALPIVSFWHLTKLDGSIQLFLLILWGVVTLGGLMLLGSHWAHLPAFQRLLLRMPPGIRNLIQASAAYPQWLSR